MNEMNNETNEWIATLVVENEDFTREDFEGWYTASVEELKLVGMDAALGGETSPQFVEMVRTAVVGKLQSNITVKATEFLMTTLGPYPVKAFSKTSVDIVCFASLNNTDAKLSILSAWEEHVHLKDDFEPLGTYKTGVSYFPDDVEDVNSRFKISAQMATNFTTQYDGNILGEMPDERIEKMRKIFPAVKCGESERNLSRLMPNQNGTKAYPDPLDIKRITVQVVGTADGVNAKGNKWAMYQVLDSSFKPTVQMKSFTVWVDSSIFERLQAGKNSFLEIYGMIQKDNNGKTSMSACFVHPLVIKPLEHKQEAQVDGMNTYVPETPQIVVQMSGAELGM